VISIFLQQRKNGKVTITDSRMTRFWITLEQSVRFVLRCLQQMHGGEIFVPKIPSMNVKDLAQWIAPHCMIETVGIRPGEKIHEVLLSEDEARHTLEFGDMYVIRPSHPWWNSQNFQSGVPLTDGFRYASDSNYIWLTKTDLEQFLSSNEIDLAVTA